MEAESIYPDIVLFNVVSPTLELVVEGLKRGGNQRYPRPYQIFRPQWGGRGIAIDPRNQVTNLHPTMVLIDATEDTVSGDAESCAAHLKSVAFRHVLDAENRIPFVVVLNEEGANQRVFDVLKGSGLNVQLVAAPKTNDDIEEFVGALNIAWKVFLRKNPSSKDILARLYDRWNSLMDNFKP